MSRTIVRIGMAIAVLLVLLIGLSFLINANRFKPALESRLGAALGREVMLGDLKLSILSGGVAASDLSIADDPKFSKTPFLRAKSLHVQAELMPLIFSHELNLTGLTIDQPEIVLLQSPAGDWNFSSLGSNGSKPAATAPGSSPARLDLSLKSLKITDGRFTLGRTIPNWTPLVLDKVEMTLTDFSNTSVFPFFFHSGISDGGAINLDGKAGPLNPADVAMTPVKAKLNVDALDLAGPGVSNLVPGIGGRIFFEGTGDSDGKVLKIDGNVRAEKLKLAKNGTPAAVPVLFVFSAEHNLKGYSGVLTRGDIRIGKAPASLVGNYAEQGGSLVLNMNLTGSNMSLPELQATLPALGIALPAGSSLSAGILNTKLSFEGPADKLVTAGTIAVSNAKLSGFDLGSKMSAIAAFAGISSGRETEVQSATANIRSTPESTAVQGIKIVAPAIGELSGGGAISPANALNFAMNATIRGSGLAAQLGKSIPFTIEGTASNPIFRPNVQGVVSQQLNRLQDKRQDKPEGQILKQLFGGKK